MSSTSTQVRGRSRSLLPWSWVLSRTPFCAPGLFLSLNSCARSWAVAGLSLPLREGQGGEFSWISCPCSPPSFLALPRSYSKASSSHLVFCFQATPLAVCPPPPVPQPVLLWLPAGKQKPSWPEPEAGSPEDGHVACSQHPQASSWQGICTGGGVWGMGWGWCPGILQLLLVVNSLPTLESVRTVGAS